MKTAQQSHMLVSIHKLLHGLEPLWLLPHAGQAKSGRGLWTAHAQCVLSLPTKLKLQCCTRRARSLGPTGLLPPRGIGSGLQHRRRLDPPGRIKAFQTLARPMQPILVVQTIRRARSVCPSSPRRRNGGNTSILPQLVSLSIVRLVSNTCRGMIPVLGQMAIRFYGSHLPLAGTASARDPARGAWTHADVGCREA